MGGKVKLKRIISLLTVLIVLCCIFSANAQRLDTVTVNTKTNAVRVTGNVKKTSDTVVHEVVPKITFDSGTSGWNLYHTASVSQQKPVMDVYEEADGNKCLRVSNRTRFNDGFQFCIADYFNQYGLGTYKISFKMRADGLKFVTSSNMPTVIMTQKTPQQKYSSSAGGVTSTWKKYNITVNITTFGQDEYGNSLQECPKGDYAASGSDGIIYIIGQSTKFNTDVEGVTTQDFRDYYLDDFSVEYYEKLVGVEGNEPLECRLSVKNGEKEIYQGQFMCNADGSYDFYAPIDSQSDYSNITANVICTAANVNETAPAAIKTNEPDFSLAYENDKLRVGVYPYDYMELKAYSEITLIAALYSDGGELDDVNVQKVSPGNSNEKVCLYLKSPQNNDCTVKLFALSDIGKLVPVAKKSVKSSKRENHMVYLIGDSICYTYDETSPNYPARQGWGYLIPEYFDECITFKNCSGGGLSTKSYISPIFAGDDPSGKTNTWKSKNDPYGCWDAIKEHLNPGDYVIMGLGVNDTSGDDDNPFSKGTSEKTYAENLKIFAQDARSRGADVIFTTMTLHGGGANQTTFENDLTLKYRQRAEVMMKTADEIGAVYVDLGKFQLDYYNGLAALLESEGKTKTEAYNTVRNYFHGGADMLHYNINGANRLAEFISYLIRNSVSGLAAYVKDFDITYEMTDVSDKYLPGTAE